VYVRWSSTGSALFLLNTMIHRSPACSRKKKFLYFLGNIDPEQKFNHEKSQKNKHYSVIIQCASTQVCTEIQLMGYKPKVKR
jgi:hypothetical protein